MNGWINSVSEVSGESPEVCADDFGWGPFKALKKAINKAANAVTKIPVVGSGLSAAYKVSVGGPVALTSSIIKGERIDKAALGSMKVTLSGVKGVAPYAATVVSFVPGVGTGVAGAIGAASALASGKSITTALAEGVKNSLPGGPIAKSAFDVAHAAVQGKGINEIALASLPISDDQKKAIKTSVNLAAAIAKGKRVDMALYDAAQKQLPKEVQTALSTGIAVAHGANLQKLAAKTALEAVPQIVNAGKTEIMSSPVLQAGLAQVQKAGGEAQRGFATGIGLMKTKVSPVEINAIRTKLNPTALKGFDMALAAHLGSIKDPLPASLPADVKFSIYATRGIKGAKPANQAALKAALTVGNPNMAKGVAIAATTKATFWQRVKKYINTHIHHGK